MCNSLLLLHFPGTTQSLLAPRILECLKKLCQCYNTYLLEIVKTVCLIFSLLRILDSGEISTMSVLIAQCRVVVAFSPELDPGKHSVSHVVFQFFIKLLLRFCTFLTDKNHILKFWMMKSMTLSTTKKDTQKVCLF